MRRILVILIGLTIYLSLYSQDNYIVTINSLNVRVAPTTKAKILGVLKENDTISVFKTENQWAEIIYNNRKAYISIKYIIKIEPEQKPNEDNKETISEKTHKQELVKKRYGASNQIWNNLGLDFLSSLYIGASDFIGDYMPIAHLGFGLDFGFQFYQKQNDLPRGWMSEASVGYAIKGGGGMPVHYFTMLISPAGYAYTFEKQDILLYALLGLSLNFGGGHLYTYRNGVSKNYYANPCDVGMQLKIATEWRKFGFAVSYDQGFINVIENSSLALKSFGFNFHFYYRLWDIPHNKIYKP